MPKSFILSKSKILLHKQCPKRLWLKVHKPELAEVDPAAEARFRDGNQVGEVARRLYPGGDFIDTLNRKEALTRTAMALEAGNKPIFEAAFLHNDVLIRADLLVPEKSGYRLVEVKSSTSVKDYHLEDITIQTWVMQQSGLEPSRCMIAHIDNSFVYPGGGQYQGLLKEEPVDLKIRDIIGEVPSWIDAAQKTLEQDEAPDIAPGDQCSEPFACDFSKYCSPPETDVEFPVEILPYGKKMAEQLRAEGYRDLRDVPEDKLTNPKHIRVHRVTKSGQAELDQEAIDAVRELPYPRYYLDFETIAFAVPIWAGTSPYKQIPFQWSCHIESADGSLSHAEFLDISGDDPRRAFAESLLETLGNVGPIIVYNAPFEGSRMKELAEAFPDLAPALLAAVESLFDLLPLARNHYYHPAMKGSWSIKAVLPTIAPELDYSNLAVAHGGMAQDAYLDLIGNELSVVENAKLKDNLLAYCEQDTLAMVKVLENFRGKDGCNKIIRK